MKRDGLTFLLPGDPDQLAGTYLYAKWISDHLRVGGYRITVRALEYEPSPDQLLPAGAIAQAEAILAGLPDGELVMVDGLLWGPLHEVLPRHAERLPLVGLVHHPLVFESGLTPEIRATAGRREQETWQVARRLIVTSDHTARTLRELGIDEDRVGTVRPGTDPVMPPDRSQRRPEVPQLLCVATVTARKGHLLLLEVLASLIELPWRLVCIGSEDREPELAGRLRGLVDRYQLTSRVELRGEVSRSALADAYIASDIFVLPSSYEGFGMALTEALAYGLPVISTTAGAIPDTVAPEAAILCEPGDGPALRSALQTLLSDPEQRIAMSLAASRAARDFPTWPLASARFAQELEKVG